MGLTIRSPLAEGGRNSRVILSAMSVQRPNILLITTDQQRADALGFNGNSVLQTPNLDALASGGVNFSQARSTCPVCIPARRSLLTGLHPSRHGLRRYQDGLEWEAPFTLPGILGKSGYQTQLIGKMHLFPQRKRYGFDHMIRSETENLRPTSPTSRHNDYGHWLRGRGVTTHPASHGIGSNSRLARPHPLDESLHHNTWLTQEAVHFLTETRDTTSPWFLHLSYFAPHPPFTPPRPYFDRYDRLREHMDPPVVGEWVPRWDTMPRGLPPDSARGPFDPEAMRNARVGYYGLINHIDDCVAHLLDRYFEHGSDRQHDPVWIVFTSDHGEMMGDHQLFRKGLPFESSTRVPFFISGRNVGIQPGECDALVCLEDVAPTVLELAGVEPPPAMVEGPNGRSLAAAVTGGRCAPREVFFEECGGIFDHHSVVAGRWKYVWWVQSNEEQVFDLTDDPRETRDLSGRREVLEELRPLMAAHIKTRSHAEYDPVRLRPLENTPPSGFWTPR